MTGSAVCIRKLEGEGWRLVRTKGSHRQYMLGARRVTVPHPVKDLPIGTLRSIFRQAGWIWPNARMRED
jgi:predicted RNA binding protein YcfA (HicA-like mRNA interferase family)